MLIAGFAGHAAASDYYEFSVLSGPGTEYDVACYGNTIYYGAGASVYKTTVSVADMSKKDEPKFLADGVTPNPNYQTRTFTAATPITLSGGGSLAGGSVGEMFVDANYIYTIASTSVTGGPSQGGMVQAFDKNTGVYVSTVVTGSSTDDVYGTGWGYDSLLSYGGGKWWLGNEDSHVYSSSDGVNWDYEFTWPDMAGGHGDGMEYVNGYIFVSDMTSNFIAQWEKVGGVWTEKNRFSYTEIGGSNKYVEGMGFGALGHFWAGSGSYIYELGGGEIQGQVDVPEPSTVLLMGVGLAALVGYSRKKKGLKK